MGSLQSSGRAVGRRRGWRGESLHLDADEVSGCSFEVPPKICRRHVPPLLCGCPSAPGMGRPQGDLPTHLDCAIDHPPFRLPGFPGRGDQCVGWSVESWYCDFGSEGAMLHGEGEKPVASKKQDCPLPSGSRGHAHHSFGRRLAQQQANARPRKLNVTGKTRRGAILSIVGDCDGGIGWCPRCPLIGKRGREVS